MTVWDGANIRVLKDVIVKEPYDETNVECTSNQRSSSIQAVEQVRKVVSTWGARTQCRAFIPGLSAFTVRAGEAAIGMPGGSCHTCRIL